ncbi:MAG TPA: hemolysin III family protein [Acidimicrobiales bacterium]|nr:hemolysin III family protein [Acidimicrobiales bacterium]
MPDTFAPVRGATGRDVPLGTPTRPAWRGRLHMIGLVLALPFLLAMTLNADGTRAKVGVAIYAVGLCSMLTASTTYHRWVHSIRARAAMRRVDHAMIYAAIAGTFTPLGLISLGTRPAVILLGIIWGAAVAGAILKLTGRRRADLVATVMYILIGWSGLVLVPALWNAVGALPVIMVFIGGVLYTTGAIGFGKKWPTLEPSVFSYHEVWHAFTLLAAGAHFAAIWMATT